MIKIKTLNTSESQDYMDQWVKNEGKELPDISDDYLPIRHDLQKLFEETKDSWSSLIGRPDYYKDVVFGIKLYMYFNGQTWFNLRTATNVDFWRYLSVMVIPDVVAQRWGVDNVDHYWKKPRRIWLSSIWWYIHLSWQNDADETKKMLLLPMFSTDTILNLVERSGREGMDIDVYKIIIKQYSTIDKNSLASFKEKSKKGDDMFRAVMRLNTARTIVVEPAFCEGGTQGYVTQLFNSFSPSQENLGQLDSNKSNEFAIDPKQFIYHKQ